MSTAKQQKIDMFPCAEYDEFNHFHVTQSYIQIAYCAHFTRLRTIIKPALLFLLDMRQKKNVFLFVVGLHYLDMHATLNQIRILEEEKIVHTIHQYGKTNLLLASYTVKQKRRRRRNYRFVVGNFCAL